MSQPIFASLLSVTASTIRAWEQGRKSPSGAARRLLEVAEIEPGVFRRLARGYSAAELGKLRTLVREKGGKRFKSTRAPKRLPAQ